MLIMIYPNNRSKEFMNSQGINGIHDWYNTARYVKGKKSQKVHIFVETIRHDILP
jgi:hypothetical protein